MVTAPLEAAELLTDWFGPAGAGAPSPAVVDRWRTLGVLHTAGWTHDPQVDRSVAARYGTLLRAAGCGALEPWLDSVAGRLAHVIACDQLPRIVHRGAPRAFAFDVRAVSSALLALRSGDAERLPAIAVAFLCMPLVHSEDEALQVRASRTFTTLLADCRPDERELLIGFDASARRHRRIIELFGRFPHRNALLGRADTGPEREYRESPWSYAPLERG